MVTHGVSGDCCPDCGGQLRQFGEDVSEQLEYIPDSFKVIRHVRPKFACNGCDRVVEAPAPSRPIERGLAGPGLLAHVLVSKFGDHLAALSPVGDLCPPGSRDRALHAGGLGRRSQRVALSAGGRDSEARAGRRQASRRRHADPGACARQRQDQDRPALDLCARRPAGGRRYRSGRLVRVLGGSQGRASTAASEELQGRPSGRRLCGVPSSVRRRRHL